MTLTYDVSVPYLTLKSFHHRSDSEQILSLMFSATVKKFLFFETLPRDGGTDSCESMRAEMDSALQDYEIPAGAE